MITIECKNCGKEKQVYPYLIRSGRGLYCSNNCSHEVKKVDPTLKKERKQEYKEKWYTKNQERLRILGKENYIKNKDAYLVRAHTGFIKRKDRYKKDSSFRRKAIEDATELASQNYVISVVNGAAMRGREWTDGEVAFLEKNYRVLTVLEMALRLDRTTWGVAGALQRYKISKERQ